MGPIFPGHSIRMLALHLLYCTGRYSARRYSTGSSHQVFVGTKTVILLVLIGFIYKRIDMFVDLALAYSILNFIGTLIISKYFERSWRTPMITATVTGAFLLAGVFLFFAATVGFLRFPDLYTGCMPPAKADALAMLLCLIGLACLTSRTALPGPGLVQSVKLIFIAVFWFTASPALPPTRCCAPPLHRE